MATATLVATAGSATANTYCTRAEADQYHDNRPPDGASTWSAATSDQKDKALLWATKLMDSMFAWTGEVVDDVQALLWPRYSMYYRSGYEVASTVIPNDLRDACAEYAMRLLVADLAADSDVEAQGLTQLTAGPVTLHFKEDASSKPVPDAVIALIPPDWYDSVNGSATGGTIELMRG